MSRSPCAGPSAWRAARIRRVKASCTIGSPPEMVRPPSSERSAGAKLAEAVDHLLRGNVGPVLQMPGIGVVAVGAAQQAARHEQHDAQAGSVVAG